MPKRAGPLSDIQIKNAEAKIKPYKLTDGDGLYILIGTSGAKYWRMDYTFVGQRRTLAFGRYPNVSLAKARDKRAAARRLLANDTDPAELQRERRRQEREAKPTTPKLRFFLKNDGVLIIENATNQLTLTAAQTFALRAFLAATNHDAQGE